MPTVLAVISWAEAFRDVGMALAFVAVIYIFAKY